MIIKLEHLKQNKEHHNLKCTRKWMSRYGLDWSTFLREGYSVEELLGAAPDDQLLKDTIDRLENK